MAAEAMAERLRQLSLLFLQGLDGELATIEADPAAAAMVVHKIAGRAGTFGHHAIGDAAARLEAVIAKNGPTGPAFAAGLAALRAVVDHSGAGHG